MSDSDQQIALVDETLLATGVGKKGDVVVITMGVPLGSHRLDKPYEGAYARFVCGLTVLEKSVYESPRTLRAFLSKAF